MLNDSITTHSIDDLRAELKRWERSFAEAHDGRKPSRDDIKRDGSIAARYSLFNRLSRPHTTVQATPQKRRTSARSEPEDQQHNAAIRRSHHLEVPVVEEEVEPTPNHVRCALGPTPQKDGFVLGIFDLISKSETPSGRHEDHNAAVAATPSRTTLKASGSDQEAQSSRSESRRFFLDAFAGTPLKRKREDDAGTPSTAKRQFDTPAFLKRESTLESIREEGDTSTVATRQPGRRKGMARSFSAILANLRKHEEERMDDDWDILRELEAEVDDEPEPVKRTAAPNESLEAEMPLGPDQAPTSDEDEPDEDGTARKPWKKKGLKRQTKRVKMKPVLHAPGSTSIDQPDANDIAAKDNVVSKTVRKVNEAAHMNFRKLKIKNKNSKAKGKGRFGKR